MKVVLATDARTAGGVGRHLADLAGGLLPRGVQVSFAGPRGSSVGRVAADLEVPFVAFEDGPSRADVWHLHLADTYDRRSVRVLAQARVSSRRVVVTEHLPRSNASDATLTDDRRTPGAASAKTMFKRVQLGLAHSVIAVSEGSRRFLIDRYGLRPDRVVTIHNGVDLDRFAAAAVTRPPAGDPPVVVAVGSLIRQKGHDLLIRAAAQSRAGWRVVVAGSGPQHDELVRLAGAVAPGRVEFRGWVDDVRALMLGASVVCLPSRWESFGYAALEGMALGRPVVATRVDGVDEVVHDGTSGLLVRPEDPAALAAAVDRVVTDARLAGELADNARRDVAAFGLESMVGKTLTHYRSLI